MDFCATPTTVVVADDHADSRQLIATLLGYRQYRVFQAADGLEALTLIEAERPDLVISDLLMPRMDGFELARRIRANADLRTLPLVFYSATYHLEQVGLIASECAVSGVITKPAGPKEVFAAVDRALRVRHMPSPSVPDAHLDRMQYAIVRDRAAEESARFEAARQRLVDVAALGQSLARIDSPVDVASMFCLCARDILLVKESCVMLAGPDGDTVYAHIDCAADGRPRVSYHSRPIPAGVSADCDAATGMLTEPAARALFGADRIRPSSTVVAPITSAGRCYGWLYVGDPLGPEHSLKSIDHATVAAMAAMLAARFESTHRAAVLRESEAQLADEAAARRRTEAELRAADEHFHVLFEDIQDGMIQATGDGTLLRVNSALLRMLGYESEAELRQLGMAGVFEDPFTRGRLNAALEEHGVVHNLEAKLRRKDGQTVHALISGRAVRRHDGSTDFYEGTIRDVTEWKLAELTRQKAEEHRQFALRAARCGTWQFDPMTGATQCGDTMNELLGVPASALPTTLPEFFRMVHPDDRERVSGVLSGMPTTEQLAALEFRIVWPDGSVHWLGGAGRLSTLAPETAPVFIGVAIDITEHRRLQDQFRQAQKMEAIGQLAGGVAHDFNNLITAISGFAELIDTGLHPADPARRDAAEITEAAKRAASLTRQLLAFSRRQVLQPRIVDVNDLVSSLIPMLSRLMRDDVILKTDLSAQIPRTMADPGQVEQVLMNLVVNARDAMPHGGTLRIATATALLDQTFIATHPGAKSGLHVLISVEDNGTGMSTSIRERIFEPFFTTKDKDQGTGLGLSTVYGIVKQSGGYISVDSELGRGTTFVVYLPALASADRSTSAPPSKGASPTGTETILLAEDDESVRKLLATVLRKQEYNVLLAADPPAALQVAAAFPGPIHLLVSDMVMPGGSGPDLFNELARNRPALKVLYTSGYAHDTAGIGNVSGPAAPFVQKPFTPHEILASVRGVLDAI